MCKACMYCQFFPREFVHLKKSLIIHSYNMPMKKIWVRFFYPCRWICKSLCLYIEWRCTSAASRNLIDIFFVLSITMENIQDSTNFNLFSFCYTLNQFKSKTKLHALSFSRFIYSYSVFHKKYLLFSTKINSNIYVVLSQNNSYNTCEYAYKIEQDFTITFLSILIAYSEIDWFI